ncbi:MAG: hypothetical protein KKF56_02935 [Nanoarchaeota archaeon]|nr:hypothetical protein [Nanoarchaeota archaeon]
MAKKEDKHNDKPEAYFIPGGIIAGIGIGLLINQVAAFTLIGLGAGFLLMAVIGLSRKQSKNKK